MYHKPTDRVLKILSYLAETPSGLTMTDLSKKLNIPKSTLSPILQELVFQNFLFFQKSTSLFFIGIATEAVSSAYQLNNELIPYIKDLMKQLTAETDEICQLGVLEGENVFYLHKEDPSDTFPIQVISHIGKRLPAYATALGKALLSLHSNEEVYEIYHNLKFTKLTDKTISNVNQLINTLDKIRKTNISSESEEITPYLCCFATPIELSKSQNLAISISLPVFRATPEKTNQIISLLLSIREKIISYESSILTKI